MAQGIAWWVTKMEFLWLLQASELSAGPVTKFGTRSGDAEGGGQESSTLAAPYSS